ncbi:MAG TPA: hypothetical protein VFL69_10730 [Marmoricola sp.]|nr:hypothetical protein [Marmoricola sp.]
MSATTRVGTALAAGYFLGRFKKLRLALIVGSALTNGKVRSSGLNLLQQGTGKLTSSPQGQELGKQISEQLLQAGRSAAMTMASSGVDRLSDSLRDRSERLRGGEASEEPEDEDEYAEDEPEDEEPQDELEEEPPAPRRRRRAASRAGGGR